MEENTRVRQVKEGKPIGPVFVVVGSFHDRLMCCPEVVRLSCERWLFRVEQLIRV
jgi:hypothetical protein